MSTPRHSFKLTIASTAIAAALPFAMTPGFISTAFAEQAASSPIISNYSATGSLTITNPQTDATYTLYRVKTYTKADDVNSPLITASEAKSMIEKENGTATLISGTGPTWSDLPLGQYYVKVSGANNVNSFVVSVPSTNADRTEWNYNISVTTKTATTGTEKKVVDENGNAVTSATYANVDDYLYYQISSAIPANVNPEKYTSGTTWIKQYVITDTIDDPNLTVDDTKYSVKVGDTSLVSNTDYSVTNGVITLTESGRKALASAWTANPNVKVVTTIKTKVNSIDKTDGAVSNNANVMWETKIENPTDPTDDTNTDGNGEVTNPSNGNTPVVTKWVKIRAKKVGNNNAALAGAKFKLYACDNSGVLGNQIKLNNGAVTEWTSAQGTGDIVIDGINTDYGTVCLVESEAPSGFELQPKPIVVSLASPDTVTGDGVTKADGPNMKVSVSAGNIVNVPSKFPTLPLTGGKGVALFAFLAALIAGATVLATRKAARK